MSNEIDLDQFIQVLDHALATDDPKIKKALKKFLFIAALAMEGDPEPGPFSEMLEEMDELRRRMRSLEDMVAQRHTQTDYVDWYGSSTTVPKWIYDNTTSTAGNGYVTVTPSTTSGVSISSTGTGNTITSTGSSTLYGPGTCSGFTSGTFTINLGDDEKGKRIKEELQEKLGTLTK